MSTSPPKHSEAAAPRWVLGALGAAAFAYAYQQTAIVPVIPTIGHAFHAGNAWSVWLLSGYLMVATVVTPALGRLGDLHGAERALIVSMVVFFAGSVGAATLPGLPAIIICRAAQGAGGAVLPLSFAVSRHHLPEDSVNRAVAGLMGVFGVGATAGFATGGWIAELVSWRLVFGAGAVMVAAGTAMLVGFVPRRPGVAEGSFDGAGMLWLAAASLGTLLALTLGSQQGWASPLTLGLLAAGAASAVAWVRTEVLHDQPLVDLRVLRNRTVSLVNAATVGLGWTRFVGLLLIPELVRGPGGGSFGFGADATVAGLFLVPDGAGLVLGGPLAGVLARWWRPARVLAVGLIVLSAGAAAVAGGHATVAAVAVGAFLLGLGGGLATQASSAVTTADVPEADAGASSSLNSMLRRFAGGVGGQVSTVILASIAATGDLSGPGFRVVFALAAGVGVLAALLASLIPRVQAPSEQSG